MGLDMVQFILSNQTSRSTRTHEEGGSDRGGGFLKYDKHWDWDAVDEVFWGWWRWCGYYEEFVGYLRSYDLWFKVLDARSSFVSGYIGGLALYHRLCCKGDMFLFLGRNLVIFVDHFNLWLILWVFFATQDDIRQDVDGSFTILEEIVDEVLYLTRWPFVGRTPRAESASITMRSVELGGDFVLLPSSAWD